jgi:hypothetical protein
MINATITPRFQKSLWALAALTALIGSVAGASPPPPDLDVVAVETDSSRVIVPADPSGKVSVTTCTTCPTLILGLTAQTEFMIDNRVVTLGEWRAFAGKGYTYGVDALYAQKDKTLLTLALNSAAKFDAARR